MVLQRADIFAKAKYLLMMRTVCIFSLQTKIYIQGEMLLHTNVCTLVSTSLYSIAQKNMFFKPFYKIYKRYNLKKQYKTGAKCG